MHVLFDGLGGYEKQRSNHIDQLMFISGYIGDVFLFLQEAKIIFLSSRAELLTQVMEVSFAPRLSLLQNPDALRRLRIVRPQVDPNIVLPGSRRLDEPSDFSKV